MIDIANLKKGIFLFLFANCITYNALACKTISKELDFQLSSDVFIGKIIHVNESGFYIKKLEVFKGNNMDTLFAFNHDHSIPFEINEVWLIYGTHKGGDSIYISGCGWSRNLGLPISSNHNFIPSPLSISSSKAENEILFKQSVLLSLVEINQDIANYRYNNLLKLNEKSNNDIEDLNVSLNKYITYIKYFIFIILFLTTLVIIELFLIIKYNKTKTKINKSIDI